MVSPPFAGPAKPAPPAVRQTASSARSGGIRGRAVFVALELRGDLVQLEPAVDRTLGHAADEGAAVRGRHRTEASRHGHVLLQHAKVSMPLTTVATGRLSA